MLLSREEMTFDFGAAKIDPVKDKTVLGWVFNQFLYGEVTGIQCGHWLYGAPDLDAARFLSRQAVEEMQHIDNFLKILSLLGCEQTKPHPALRFLATGMMGDDWAEHVALEMAQGEGLVLMALYALIDTLDHPEIVAILNRAVKQEERHVDFGEQRTLAALEQNPKQRKRLLGLSLVSLMAVEQLGNHLHRLVPAGHPVWRQLPAFVKATLRASELRLQRLGILDRPLGAIGAVERALLIGQAYGDKALAWPGKSLRSPKRLTDTYVQDPAVVGFMSGEESAMRAAKVNPTKRAKNFSVVKG
jgi:bacterioferritin (cytochrome b1)